MYICPCSCMFKHTVFVRIEAPASISFWQVLTRPLFEPGLYSNPAFAGRLCPILTYQQNGGRYRSTITTPPDFRRNKIYSSEICLYKITNISNLYFSRLEAYKVTLRLSLWAFRQAYVKHKDGKFRS